MQIGDYSLGQNISDHSHLIEVSRLEYLALPKMFRGEIILRAPDVAFLGYSWNMVLGVINHHVYKLSAQFISDNYSTADKAYSEAIKSCSNQYGKPLSGKELPSFMRTSYKRSGWTESEINCSMVWDTSFGNIIIDRKFAFDDHYVNFQVTSNSLLREMPLRLTLVQTGFALVQSTVTACAFSFATYILLGVLFGVLPNKEFISAVIWAVLAIASFFLMVKNNSPRSWFSIPFAVVGALVLFGAFVGMHPLTFVVALVMFVVAVLVWRMAQRSS